MINDRYSRQSFLGDDAQAKIETCVVGIVGLGGGGSHIVQQLSHLGFRHFVLFDPDRVEFSNLNRLIGATQEDATTQRPKVLVARRLIMGLQPEANVIAFDRRWQEAAHYLRLCDLIFGCVDGFAERRDLEAVARRHLIPYIDIGIDVFAADGAPPALVGQAILSMPGGPCLSCLGYITEERLAREAAQYGAAGPRPQVVWANGVMASSAVGIGIAVLTGWANGADEAVYLSYRGNHGTVQPHVRLQYLNKGACPHYPPDKVGTPVYVAF